MRNIFLIALSILMLSGCLTADFIAVANQERLESERFSNADALCKEYKVFAHTLQYDACLANALGIDQKQTGNNVSSMETNGLQYEEFVNNINELPNTASGLSYPEFLCNKYGYPPNAPERGICLENAGDHPIPVAFRIN